MSSPPGAAGFVLAGGRSSRMGQDKARIELGGQPLIWRAVELLRSAGLDAAIAAPRPDLADFAPVVADDVPDSGPLGGICSALAATHSQFAVFIPVDMPLLPPSLLQYLLKEAQRADRSVVFASINGFIQTFPVVLGTRVLPSLKEELAAGRRGCSAAICAAAEQLDLPVRTAPVEDLVQIGKVLDPRGFPPQNWFLNVNTPADLERLRFAFA